MGQKKDFLSLFLGQPRHGEGHNWLHVCGLSTAGDKLVYTGWGYGPCQRSEHLEVDTADPEEETPCSYQMIKYPRNQ